MNTRKLSPNVIDASPTKGFFISMVIRDLSLRDAIGDLLDNSVDSARYVIQDDNYSDIEIDISLSSQKFSIKDNCAGMRVEIARDYAFRFGRPEGPNSLNHLKGSIGQFGIGMKRALFKIGKKIYIKSIADESRFEIDLDVDKWQSEEKWDFNFKSYSENEINSRQERGVEIIVENLKDDAFAEFNDQTFLQGLIRELEFEHLYPLSKGLTIKVNGHSLKKRSLDLLTSNEIKPAFYEHRFSDGVYVKISAGIGASVLEEGGWYIFGNERLILGPEQSAISGWTGSRNSDGVANYHGQYQMFRGYVFFQADNASLLPWNTAKNGVDIDSPKFKFVRQQMIEVMRPVISFLNQMKAEREGNPAPTDLYLQNKVNAATKISVDKALNESISLMKAVTQSSSPNVQYSYPMFIAPTPPKKEKNKVKTIKISYSKSKDEVDLVKKSLKVTTPKEVGEATFTYYIESEL